MVDPKKDSDINETTADKQGAAADGTSLTKALQMALAGRQDGINAEHPTAIERVKMLMDSPPKGRFK